MSVSPDTYQALLQKTAESLRWLAESGIERIEVPPDWQLPDLTPLHAEPELEGATAHVTDTPSAESAQSTTSDNRFGRLLSEIGGGDSTPSRRRAAPTLRPVKSVQPVPVAETEIALGDASQAFEDLLEEENIVDPQLRQQFKRVLSFEQLRMDYQKKDICPLCRGRQEPVLPTMGRACRAVFIADQPDEREQLMGVPYVGETGALVARMVKAMGLTREEVGFAYVNNCSHAEAPADELAEHWQPLLDRYLALANPEVIVAFGECAARRLTGQTLAFPHLRGQWFEYEGTPVLSTFHPTALIQHPQGKSVVWGDLKNVMRKLGLTIAKK